MENTAISPFDEFVRKQYRNNVQEPSGFSKERCFSKHYAIEKFKTLKELEAMLNAINYWTSWSVVSVFKENNEYVLISKRN